MLTLAKIFGKSPFAPSRSQPLTIILRSCLLEK